MVNLFPYFWKRKDNYRLSTGLKWKLNIKNTLIYGWNNWYPRAEWADWKTKCFRYQSYYGHGPGYCRTKASGRVVVNWSVVWRTCAAGRCAGFGKNISYQNVGFIDRRAVQPYSVYAGLVAGRRYRYNGLQSERWDFPSEARSGIC